MNDRFKSSIKHLSPNELDILEYFAKMVETAPSELKEYLYKLPLKDKARLYAFIKSRCLKLWLAIEEIIY